MKNGEYEIRVRYAETDQMGVVYYANYLVWLETGRSEYFRDMGMPYSEVEKNDILLPVTKVFCQYKSPARYDDVIRIVTSISSLQDVRIHFKYELFRKNSGELLAIAETEHAFVNRQGRPVVLKKHNPFLWKRLLEAAGEHAE